MYKKLAANRDNDLTYGVKMRNHRGVHIVFATTLLLG